MSTQLKMAEVSAGAALLAGHLPKYGGGVLVGIPRGGIVVAAIVASIANATADSPWSVISPGDAWPRHSRGFLVDDVIASGRTLQVALETEPWRKYEGILALFAKSVAPSIPEGAPPMYVAYNRPEWLVFPWEVNETSGPEDAVRRLIEYSGDDPNRDGLVETPRRVLAYYDELRQRREEELSLTTFDTEYGDLMIVRDIPLASLCEHHMMLYEGRASVGYIPGKKTLGLSKVARIVAQQQSGLTMQETLTSAIAAAIAEALDAEDVAVVTTASHSCMTARGVRMPGTATVVSKMLGGFHEDASLRSEFLQLMGAHA